MNFASEIWNKPAAAAADDVVTKSLRCDSASSAQLSRTPSATSATRTKWVFSTWVKRSKLGSTMPLYQATGTPTLDIATIHFGPDDRLEIAQYTSAGGYVSRYLTEMLFRDPAAWYHIVVVFDSTDAEADRVKLYVNGVLETVWNVETRVGASETWSYGTQVGHKINNFAHSNYIGDGYHADINWLDGTVTLPSGVTKWCDVFAEEDATTGQWKPKATSGLTFGTNGFHLDFEDDTAIGNDVSGNDNDFTTTNLAASDIVNDTPTSNFCTWNTISGPPRGNMDFSEGNLKSVGGYDGSYFPRLMGTMAASSGKWFWEVRSNGATTNVLNFGFKGINTTWPAGGYGLGGGSTAGQWVSDGEICWSDYENGIKSSNSGTALDSTLGDWANTAGNVAGIAIDLDASPRTLQCYLNGSSVGSSVDIPSGGPDTFHPALDHTNLGDTTCVTNFGQDATFNGTESGTTYTTDANGDDTGGEFYHQPPAGYKAWTTKNLTPTIAKPKEYFDVLTYSGSGAKTFDNGDTTMQPDLVWVKARGNAYDHELTDSVRGVTKALSSNATNVESTDSTGLTAFGSDGFTVGAGTNYSTSSMVAWAWKKSTTAGFGISTWTGTGSEDGDEIAVAHGCGGTPELVIAKDRDSPYGQDWIVWHHNLPTDRFVSLNTSTYYSWDSSYPLIQAGATNTTFGLDSATSGLSLNDGSNSMGGETTYVAYSMRSIEGYSKIGGWAGDSVSGKFIYTGFRPKFLLYFHSYTGGHSWGMMDDKREPYNPIQTEQYANQSLADYTSSNVDFLSNGFRIHATGGHINQTGGDYIFYAVGQSLKYANAR